MCRSTQGTLVQRPRALYSCGVSALTVGRKAYHRVEKLSGPMGAVAKKLAAWAAPIVHPLQRKWLSLLSFADSYVLVLENAVTSVCPSAAHLFRLLDELALLSEALPKKFDDAADHLPSMIHRLPLANWVSAELGEGWKLLASMWELERPGEEREIGVDTTVDEVADALREDNREAAAPMHLSNSFDGEKALESDEERAREMAQRLQKVGVLVEECIIEEEETIAKKLGAGKAGEGAPQPQGGVVVKDSILELSDEGWCM